MTTAIPTLRLEQFVPAGGWYHIAWWDHGKLRRLAAHTHDFVELFWVATGKGFHLVNDQRIALTTGDLTLMRTSDIHTYALGGDQMTLVNIAFSCEVLADIRARYAADGTWPWREGPAPPKFHLSWQGIERLTMHARRLAMEYGQQRRLTLDRFLMELLDLLLPTIGCALVGDGSTLPTWLDDAIALVAADKQALRDGLPALVALAGRTREHLARVVRERLGVSSTSLINELRLQEATHLLQRTDMTPMEVAMEVGLGNLGYFYRLFKQRFGVTPRQYRLQQQAVLRGVVSDPWFGD